MRRPGLHTPNEPIRSCRGELMWRDAAKFREEPGRDGDGERGVIDWPFCSSPSRGPTVNMREGFNAPEVHLSANFPTHSCV